MIRGVAITDQTKKHDQSKKHDPNHAHKPLTWPSPNGNHDQTHPSEERDYAMLGQLLGGPANVVR
jgi:hypothetical protein